MIINISANKSIKGQWLARASASRYHGNTVVSSQSVQHYILSCPGLPGRVSVGTEIVTKIASAVGT